MNHAETPYPLTITPDRYNGTYSGAKWLAWNEDPEDVPKGPYDSDAPCMEFWRTYRGSVGKGNTIEEAIADLSKQPQEWEVAE